MNLKICDICYATDGSKVDSVWRIGLKNKHTSFRLDACNKHKDWMKGKTLEKARDEFYNIEKEK